MCGNCVRQCCAWVCHRSWFHAHRTHLSFLFCFVLYSRITWSTSSFIGLFHHHSHWLFLIWMHPFWLSFPGMCLANFIQAITLSPFTIHLCYCAPILNSPSHRSCTSNRWSPGLCVFFVLDCNEEYCYCFNNARTFSTCNSSLGLESWVLLIKDDIAFVFIHWSIDDVPFIWTTSRFHHLSIFDYLSSPLSISGQSTCNSFLVFFVALAESSSNLSVFIFVWHEHFGSCSPTGSKTSIYKSITTSWF